MAVPPFIAPPGEDDLHQMVSPYLEAPLGPGPCLGAKNLVLPRDDHHAEYQDRIITEVLGIERTATLRDVWDILQQPAQSDSERAERLLDRFRIVHK